MVDRAALAEAWRVACPEGHVRLDPAAEAETAYCASCECAYEWTALVDRKARPTRE